MHTLSFKEFMEMAARRQTGRLLQQANDPQKVVVAITAHRGEQEVWPGAMKQLEQDLRKLGFGTTPTTGGYQEGGIRVDEPSLFASMPAGQIANPEQARTLVKLVVQLADKYQQMGVIVKAPGEQAYEYTTRHHDMGAGKRIPYGTATRQKEPAYYTRPRFRDRTKHGTDGITFDPKFDQAHDH